MLEYLALFVIVLLHEFGHALACRQVGGQADQIVLWPLGGVAYVAPPPRPGATLWSIAAGPLVNVVLVPVLTILWFWAPRLVGARRCRTSTTSSSAFHINCALADLQPAADLSRSTAARFCSLCSGLCSGAPAAWW